MERGATGSGERGATGVERRTGSAKDYRDLKVYRLAFECALQVHELTKRFPRDERYSLIDQIRRASRSVCTNIVEAWRKRRYPNHFVSKLSDADMEAGETLVWLEFSREFGYIAQEEYSRLADDYDHICRQLNRMMTEPGAWVPLASASRRSTLDAPRSTS